jgi:glycerol-3-phosphate acyltransferase PlsY
MTQFLPNLLAIIAGYLLGSIPFGLLLTRRAGTEDLRAIGSGNIGATNVLRTGRKDLAAATLLLDALKGTAAVMVGRWLAPDAAAFAALAAFLGHIFPVWLNFRGGKGVATFLGALFGLHWPTGLLFCCVWLAVAGVWRFSSLAALVASFIAPVALFLAGEGQSALVAAVMAAMLWRRHSDNISRLLSGAESRIGQKE